jgi:hypothetical protein
VAFRKILTMYHAWIHPLHHSLLVPPPLIPEIISTDIIFPFTATCIQHFYCIHHPSLFPNLLPTPTGTNIPKQDLLHHPFHWFCIRKEEKNDICGCLR